MPEHNRRKTSKRSAEPKSGRKHTGKYKTDICNDMMTFADCELAIVHQAIEDTENIKGAQLINNPEVKKMLKIVEEFIIRKKLICYGGTAINNILPKYAQFYNRDIEIPDYDFFSPNALNDAIELADIYYKEGYAEVEAKAGVHYGTFKVFVNFIPIADITYLNKQIYDAVSKDSIQVAGIRYAPPNYLRMGMYLELSRPAGDVSRWEKVFKRLTLLNKYYPLIPEGKCESVDFNKNFDIETPENERSHMIVRDALIDNGVVFFGGYSTYLFSKYMNQKQEQLVKKIPDFDVIAEDYEKCALIVKERLHAENITNVKLIKHDAIGEIIPRHIEIMIGKHSMAYLYEPIACHSYNKITIDNRVVNIATIETILSFYLSFIYADMPHYDKNRLLCIANFIFEVERKNRLSQDGILKRFSINCSGKQKTLETMRADKAAKYKELQQKKRSKEYDMWFLRYIPGEDKSDRKIPKKMAAKRGSDANKTRKSQVDDEPAEETQGILTKMFGL
jgi:hypothetical protein